MHEFPKGTEGIHVYIAEILHQMFPCDTMFESVRILGFPKSMDDSYAHKAEIFCQLYLRYSCMPAFSPNVQKACIREYLSHTSYIYELISEPITMVYLIG